MNEAGIRVVGYGTAAAVLAGLVYGGFIYRAEADLTTTLSSIDTQLRLAHAIPAVDKQGKPLSARLEMLASVDQMLTGAEALHPDNPMLAEYRGFLCMLRGEHQAAAGHYRRARAMPGVDADMRDTLVFNEARLLAKAGMQQQALQVYEQYQGGLQAKFQDQGVLEQAELLAAMGRSAEAQSRLAPLLRDAAVHPSATVQAGRQLEALGCPEAAEAAYEAAARTIPGANYWRSLLKLRLGQTDRCLELLALAVAAAPAEVRQLVDKDQQTWQGLANDARFQRLMDAGRPAAPGR